jgi:thioredoxin-related protein
VSNRQIWKGFPVVVIVLVSTVLCGATEPAKDDGFKWSGDLKAAWEVASEQQRPLLVFVTMDGCPHCQKMKQTTLRDKSVQRDLKSRFVTVALNLKDEPDFIGILRIRTFPAMVVIQPNGDVLESISGYQTPKQLREKLLSTARQASLDKKSPKVR